MAETEIRVMLPDHIVNHIATVDDHGTQRSDFEYEIPLGGDTYILFVTESGGGIDV